MPSPLSFFPVDCAPPTPASNPSASTDAAKPAPDAFDRALSDAAPGTKTPPRAVTGDKRPTPEKTKSSVDTSVAGEDKSREKTSLTPEELAALLALMGSSATVPTPPRALATEPVDPAAASEIASDASATDDLISSESASSAATADARLFQPRAPQGDDSSVSKFSLPPSAETAGETAPTSARDLLAQGADVIDYDLASPASATAPATTAENKNAPAANAATTSVPSPAATSANSPITVPAAETPAKEAAPAPTSAPASTAPELRTNPAVAENAATTARAVAEKPADKTPKAKIAATAVSRESAASSGVISSKSSQENNFLSVDNQKVESESRIVGTRAANWGDSMNSHARSTPFVPAAESAGAASVGATFPSFEHTAPVSEPAAASATQAAQIVREIRDIADGLWAVERNSVEVRFNFSENERLSVKVEYRDGVVKTTFRTDSPELRDTLAREWQTQVASVSDARPYRVADPVFNTPPADARGFSLGGDSSRQQRQPEQTGQGANTFAATFGRSSSASSSPASAPAAAGSFVRPDTALHLNAFA